MTTCNRRIFTASLIAIVLILTQSPLLAAPMQRIPWTTGHVSGAPGTPPPYELQRIFPKLKFKEPVEVAFAPGSNRVFVAEKPGRIVSFINTPDAVRPDLFVSLQEIITDWKNIPGCKGIDGVYGVAFHPKFQDNHYVYLCYVLNFATRTEDPIGSRVSRFTVVGGDVPKIDPGSEKLLFQWQAGGHNGGSLKFGLDGCLYISTGDQADPHPPDVYNTGQDISDLRASILRIDVDHTDGDKNYAIPRDNPFVKTPGARGEVFCYGLRNPWRMSFDRVTGRLWVGDVGWELYESIHCVKAGGNYGWSIMEGPNPIHPDGKRGPTPITPPLISLSHAQAASITGGFVYRGKKHPELVGHYIFGDWETRRIWDAKLIGEDKVEPYRTLAQTDARIVAFGEDADGELYVADHEGGCLYELVPNQSDQSAAAFPRTLKDTGLFTDVAHQTPAPGVVPYVIKAPQWVDGATAEHFVAIPGTGNVRWQTDDVFERLTKSFPKNSVLVRTFSIDLKTGDPATRRKIETQLLHFDGRQWHGYTYRWRDDQTDADLVDDNGGEQRLTIEDPAVIGGKRQQTWHYASRTQCLTCHTIHAGYVVGYNDAQLDLTRDMGNGPENQLAALRAVGLAAQPYDPKRGQPAKPADYSLVNPEDTSASLDDRARSYLHANCAHCHREHGGGSALIDLRKEKPLSEMRVANQPAMLGAFDIDNPRIITPGDPSRSVLLYRIAKTGSGRMPHVGSDIVDDRGVELIARWIADSAATPEAKRNRYYALRAIKFAADTPAQPKDLDELLKSSTGSLSIINAIETGDVSQPRRQQVINQALQTDSLAAHDLFDRFSGRDMSPAPKLGPNFDRAKLLATRGDIQRGRNVFQNVAQCAACHLAAGVKGREFGPDLSHIATKYTREQLLENIVEPSKTITEGFTAYNVMTNDGDLVSGFLISRSEKEVVIKDATLQQIHIPAAEMKSITPQALSIMPEGLLTNLEPQQAADLLEMLASQK
jgi:putative heme-binding domain-containing protein